MPYVGRDLSRGNYLKLDDLVSQFNGSTTTFNLTSGGSAFFPGSAFSILVSLGGIVQEPESAYTINKSQITFASAPLATDEFFIIALGVALGVGVPGHGTVGGSQLTKPLDYDDYFYLDSTNNRVGIHSSTPTVALDVIGDIKLNGSLVTGGGGGLNGGIVTCTGLDVNGNGDISGTLNVTGNSTFGGNVSIGGTLTYLDVTNIDSVGIITAQQGIHLGAASTVGHLSTVGVSSITSLQVRDLTATHIVYAGANGRLTGSSNITYDGTTFAVAEPSQFSDDVFINVRGKKFKTSDWNIFNTTSGNALTINGGAADTEKIRIDSSGHVGIGTIPNDVDSIGKALNIASSTGGAIYLQDNDAPTVKFGAISYNGVTAGLQIHAHHSSSYIDLGTNGTERVRINDSGYVGINTNVMSNAERLAVQLGNDEMFELRSAAQELFQVWKEGSTEECRINVKHGGSTKIHLRGNGVSYFNGGNVGIGENNPTSLLHLKRSSTTAYSSSATNNDNTVYILNEGAGGHASIQFQTLSGGTANTGQANINVFCEGNSAKNTAIAFGTRGSSGNPTEKLRIRSSGQVEFKNGSFSDNVDCVMANGGNMEIGAQSTIKFRTATNQVLLIDSNGLISNRNRSSSDYGSPQLLIGGGSSTLTMMGDGSTNDSSYTGIKFRVAGTSTGDYTKAGIFAKRMGGYNDLALIFAMDTVADASSVAISDEKMRVTSAGEVLIGRWAWGGNQHPNDINKLVVSGASPADAYDSQCYLEGSETNGNANTGGALAFGGHDGSSFRNWGNIYGMKENGTGGNTAAYMAFHTRAAGGGPAEKMRITSGGNVNIGGNYTQTTYTMRVTGSFAATTKSFVIDHPTKENHKLRYACLEGPENSVYIRGRSSDSVIELPDYWVGLVHENSITVNVTPIGNKKVWVESINNNSVTIGSDDSTEYFYTVFAERKDVDKLEVEVEN